MKQTLEAANSDTKRIDILNALSDKLKDNDWIQALSYARKAYTIAQKNKKIEQETRSLLQIGSLLYANANRDSSFYYYQLAIDLSKSNKLYSLQQKGLSAMAKYYMYWKKDLTKAIECFNQSIEVSKSAKDYINTGRVYARIAVFYANAEKIDEAEKHMEKAKQTFLQEVNSTNSSSYQRVKNLMAFYYCEIGNKIWGYNMKRGMDFYLKGLEIAPKNPHVNTNIGKTYSRIGKPEKALDYLNRAIEEFDKIDNDERFGLAMVYLAEVHTELGNYATADSISDANIAYLLPLEKNVQKALPLSYINKGILKEKLGRDDEAFTYYQFALSKALELGKSYERAIARLSVGKFYIKNDLVSARKYCERALKDSKKNNYSLIEAEACDCLYNVSKKQEKFAKALEYFEEKEKIVESLSEKNAKHALDIYNVMATKDKEVAIQAEKLKSQFKINRNLTGTIIGGGVLILFLILSIKRINKQNEEITYKTLALENSNLSLKQSNEELEHFAYIASHDLKTPLFNIIRFTGLLKRKLRNSDDPGIHEAFTYIENGGKRMNKLIEDILEYSKLSSVSTTNKEIIKIQEVIYEITKLVLVKSENSHIDINVDNAPLIKWNYSKIFILFKNIIENGLKYNESEKVTVKIYDKFDPDAHMPYTIIIEDNGIGINKEYFEQIFVMFERLHNQKQYNGTGLGLATCKKIVDEFEGQIIIDSEVGKGTTFEIGFPETLIHQEKG